MEKAARRRHQVPAFGEWNYHYHYDEPEAMVAVAVAQPAAAYCYGNATPEPEACSDVWFRYSPPPRKPATPKKKARRPAADSGDASAEKTKGRRARPASEAGGLARAARVVRPVDEDLYQVPPPELASGRRRPRRRSLWMGCLGCVA